MKGFFKPKNPHKYKGDPTRIVYRSSYELKFMSFCDSQTNILRWSSEEFFIPYRSSIDGKIHRYFPDFWVEKKTVDGGIEIDVIEVKPSHETLQPKMQTKMSKRYLYEVKTWVINNDKWAAASKWCEERRWNFRILTEYELGIKKR